MDTQPSLLHQRDISSLSLAEIRHVALLTQTLNFGRAAELAGISQSALSQSIAKIEKTVGLQLFERNRRSVTATPVALLVAEHAEQVAHTMKNLQVHIDALRDSRSGSIDFGIGIFAANHLLNPIMVKTHERFPDAEIKVTAAPVSGLRDKLRAGSIEFYLAADDPQFHDESSVREPLYSEELVVACRIGHPLNQLNQVTHADIIKYPAVTYDGTFLKRQLYPLLSSAYEFDLVNRNFPSIALQQPWLMADFARVSDHIIISTKGPLRAALQAGDLVALTPVDLDLALSMQLVHRDDAARTPLYDGVVAAIFDVISEQALTREPGVQDSGTTL